MKLVIGLMVLSISGISALGQQAPTVTGFAVSQSEKVVKNFPFTADTFSESIQTLFDGNRIVRSSTGKLYRNSEGRFRRENQTGSGGLFGTYYSFAPLTTIHDPVVGFSYQIDSTLKTAHQTLLRSHAELKLAGSALSTSKELKEKAAGYEKQKSEYATTSPAATKEYTAAIEKLNSELKSTGSSPAMASGQSQNIRTAGAGGNVLAYTSTAQSKYETKTENLGTRNVEGVDAEGTRKVTTIPAGAIGNDRPIEIVYESWFSQDLQMVVMSKQSDPRFGEQTYRLTNILRTEPDPSLFSLPTGYKIITAPTAVFAPTNAKPFVLEKVTASPKIPNMPVKPAPVVVNVDKPKS